MHLHKRNGPAFSFPLELLYFCTGVAFLYHNSCSRCMPYIELAQSGLQVAFSPDRKNELKTGLVDVQAGKGRGG